MRNRLVHDGIPMLSNLSADYINERDGEKQVRVIMWETPADAEAMGPNFGITAA